MSKTALILGYGFKEEIPLQNRKEIEVETPYGKPSSRIITGILEDKEIAILYRHGIDEAIPSYLVNFKANIFALYQLGCTNILATSVCGSLQEEICVGEFVIFDQFVDLSKHRELTFTDEIPLDKLNHSAFNKPFSDTIRDTLIEQSVVNGCTVHTKCTVMAVDGPRQSTRAESNLFRSWGADVINTSTAPEAILSHELNINYGAISLCTYYDTWRTDILPSTRNDKLEAVEQNAKRLYQIVEGTLVKVPVA